MAIGKNTYTVGEEIFNSVTHGVGALSSLIGGSVLVTMSAYSGETIKVVSAIIYGLGLIILYTMSTLYHAFPFQTAKKIFRILDHSSIFILIAATYTPFLLILLKGNTKAFIIFWVLWGVCALGILINALALKKFEKFSLFLYVAMGWAAVLLIMDIIKPLPPVGIWLLAGGGIAYTGGIFFYRLKIKFMHSVWHMFVLLGSLLHFLCISIFVY